MRRSGDFFSTSVSDAVARLGKRIRRARKAQRLTLADLERMCRVHRTTIGRLERGDTGASLGALFTVLEALNELADVELLLTQPDTPKHRRNVATPILDQEF